MLNGPLETIQYRRDKLNWLKSLLTSSADLSAMSFGVEIECLLPVGVDRYSVVEKLAAVGVIAAVEGYNHTTGGNWKIVTDGSLGDYTRGMELVSPVLYGDPGLDQCVKAANVLKSLGCKLTKKCGFHVHVGARDEGVNFFRCLAKLYASAESTIDTFMAPSRRGRNNTFAQPVQFAMRSIDAATNVVQIAEAMGQSRHMLRGPQRYKKLNFMSFWQHGTVEFRQHQGTIEADKIRNWVRFCLLMCAAAKAGKTFAGGNLDYLMATIEASEGERSYFRSRVDHFNRALDRASRVRGPVDETAGNAFEEAGGSLTARATSRGRF
jgi:hypothetical protein